MTKPQTPTDGDALVALALGDRMITYSKYHIQFEYRKNDGTTEWLDSMGANDDLDRAKQCMAIHNNRPLVGYRTGQTRIVLRTVTDEVVDVSCAAELVVRALAARQALGESQ